MDEPEFTLPRVMRYLQTEWQKAERERIQWDIERADLKSRLAKLEGEKQHLQARSDTLERSNELLQRRVAQKDGTPKQSVELPSEAGGPADLSQLIESKRHLARCVSEIRILLEQSGITPEETPFKESEILERARSQKFGAMGRLHGTLANYADEVSAIVFLHGLTLVLGTSDGRLVVLDVEDEPNSPARQVYHAFDEAVTCLEVDRVGDRLFAADAGGRISVWHYSVHNCTLTCDFTLDAHQDAVMSLSFNRGQSLLVSASQDGTCGVWNYETGNKVTSMRFYPESVATKPTCVLFSETLNATLSSHHVIVAHTDSSMVVADPLTGQFVKRLYTPPSQSLLESVMPQTTAMVACSTASGEQLLITGHATGDLRVWDMKTCTLKEEIEAAHRRAITALAVSPRQDTLLTTSADGRVTLWTLQLGSTSWKGQLLSHDGEEAAGALSCDWSGDMVAVGGGDQLVRVYTMV